MITIRSSQLSAFAEESTLAFEASLVRHVETAFPDAYSRLTPAGTADLAHRTVERARSKGMDTTGAIVSLLEMVVLFGESFADSPDGEQALEILNDPELPGQIKSQLLLECLTSRTGGRRIVSASR